jgi:hypothetical protein
MIEQGIHVSARDELFGRGAGGLTLTLLLSELKDAAKKERQQAFATFLNDLDIFEKYGKIGEPSLMKPYFSPSENGRYECGHNGFYSFGYSKSVWKDGKLVTQEHLDEIINIDEGFDYKTYNEGLDYKRSKKYALFDSNYKLIMETNEIDELPNKWAEVIRE